MNEVAEHPQEEDVIVLTLGQDRRTQKDDIELYDPEDLEDQEYFRDLLLKELEQQRAIVSHANAALSNHNGSRDKNNLEDHSEISTTGHFNSMRGYEKTRALKHIRVIDAALKRMNAGTYGLCFTCTDEGHPISRARLESAPHTRQCAHAKGCRNC